MAAVDLDLASLSNQAFATIRDVYHDFQPELFISEIGEISTVFNGIAKVIGLPGVGYEELLQFPGELYGIAFNVEEQQISVILLGQYEHLKSGDRVYRTGRVVDVPVGENLLGRVIDPLGKPLDSKGQLRSAERRAIERPAPSIMDRAAVNAPLQTGIKVIDTLIPIGRGQRELIIGDRQTGKTAIALDTMINQHDQHVVCIYCGIGQRSTGIAKVIAELSRSHALAYSIILVAEGNDPPGLKYIAPYAATTIGEYFMDKGLDVLIIYDDLTEHARAYREISLLMRRPPGREAFPGDIFYVHSRLLERATHLRKELGGGSLTALPIIVTEGQNLSDYIPTNLISITDGQIFLSPGLFELGVLPAVDVGLSVSRVGTKAQKPAYQALVGDLKLKYAQFEELETFSRFGTQLDQNSKLIIQHGQRIRSFLKQRELAPVSIANQLIALIVLREGLLDDISLPMIEEAETMLGQLLAGLPSEVFDSLAAGELLASEASAKIVRIANEKLKTLMEQRHE